MGAGLLAIAAVQPLQTSEHLQQLSSLGFDCVLLCSMCWAGGRRRAW